MESREEMDSSSEQQQPQLTVIVTLPSINQKGKTITSSSILFSAEQQDESYNNHHPYRQLVSVPPSIPTRVLGLLLCTTYSSFCNNNLSINKLYYTLMHVRNPGMDTGSYLTWIQCDAPCKRSAKGPNPLYKLAKANILPPNDKLCVQVQSNHNHGSYESCHQYSYEIDYADLSSSIGVLTRDSPHLTVANGTLVKPNFVLGCAYNQQGQLSVSHARTDAILRLSRSSISLLFQLSDEYMFLGDEPVPRMGMTCDHMGCVIHHSYHTRDLFHTEIVKLSYGGWQLSLDESGNNGGRFIVEDAFHEELVRDVSDPTLPLYSKWWIISSKMKIPPKGCLIISVRILELTATKSTTCFSVSQPHGYHLWVDNYQTKFKL
ncbi:hypothetical protein MKX01_001114 [Papaver californicum]|nr:hypothetical protein MKX01_001114 [Papaver californicum]